MYRWTDYTTDSPLNTHLAAYGGWLETASTNASFDRSGYYAYGFIGKPSGTFALRGFNGGLFTHTVKVGDFGGEMSITKSASSSAANPERVDWNRFVEAAGGGVHGNGTQGWFNSNNLGSGIVKASEVSSFNYDASGAPLSGDESKLHGQSYISYVVPPNKQSQNFFSTIDVYPANSSPSDLYPTHSENTPEIKPEGSTLSETFAVSINL